MPEDRQSIIRENTRWMATYWHDCERRHFIEELKKLCKPLGVVVEDRHAEQAYNYFHRLTNVRRSLS